MDTPQAQLGRKKRLQIGVQAPPHNAYGRELVKGIQTYAFEHANWDLWWDQHRSHEFAHTHPLDGLIAVIHQLNHVPKYESLTIPVVAATGMAGKGRLPLVTIDNIAIGRMVADYFLDLGFEHLAYHSELVPKNDGRREGYIAQIEARRPEASIYQSQWVSGMKQMPPIERQARLMEFLKDIPQPVAVMAADDTLAVEVIAACHRLGFHVPDQVAVMGVDNDELACGLCQPPISSIDLSANEVGYRAATMLHRLIRGEPVSLRPEIVAPAGVIERPSTEKFAIHDVDLTMALRRIKESACEGITSQQIIQEVSVSRTALEKRFQKHLGRSIHQELVRVRLTHVKRLLRTTELPMPDIAARCGFSYASQLSHVFRREVGLTPMQYRRERRVPRGLS